MSKASNQRNKAAHGTSIILYSEAKEAKESTFHVSIEVIRGLISVFPCDEDDVMSFKVPERLLLDHKCVMRINSKRFVHGIMKSNDLDISRTYTLFGKYLADKNMAVFSLVDGVAIRVK